MGWYEVFPIGDVEFHGLSSSSPGVVVGNTWVAGPPFTFSVTDGLTIYDGLQAVQLMANGVDNAQPPKIVGSFMPPDTAGHACVWPVGASAPTDLHPLLPFDEAYTEAVSMNDAGDIVGQASHAWQRGWLLRRGGNGIDLTTTVNASIWSADKITNGAHPLVLGIRETDLSPPAYLYDTAGQGTFHPLPSACRDAMDVNDSGVVVGAMYGDSESGWLYDHKSGIVQEIPHIYGGKLSEATGINNFGQFVGASGGSGRGYIGSYQSGEIIDVHPIDDDVVGSGPNGWSISFCFAINNAGEILAEASWRGELETVVLLEPLQSTSPSPGLASYIQILFGVINDAPGVGLVGRGHPVNPDPYRPWLFLEKAERDLLLGIGINGLAKQLSDPSAREEFRRAYVEMVRRAAQRLEAPNAPVYRGAGPTRPSAAGERVRGRERLLRLRKPRFAGK